MKVNNVTVRGYAKVNLGLDIVGKLENGYHLLKSIMQQIDLYDDITVTRIESGIIIDSNSKDIPVDSSNLAYKAAKAVMDECGIGEGVKIYIEKRIPMAAGMAGGSSDAAAVIKGMNELFNLQMSMTKMQEIGVKLGADIPFCIAGGACLCEGIGEQMKALTGTPKMCIVVAKPPIGISTAYVYSHIKLDSLVHPDVDSLVKAYNEGDVHAIASGLGNVLESVSEAENVIITVLKREMLEAGAMASLMSGSGPTVFGLFEDMDAAAAAAQILSDKHADVFVKACQLIQKA